MRRAAIVFIMLTAIALAVSLLTRDRIPNLAGIGRRVPGFSTNYTPMLDPWWHSQSVIELVDRQGLTPGSRFTLDVETGKTVPYRTPHPLAHFSRLSPDMNFVLRHGGSRWELTDKAGTVIRSWPLLGEHVHWAPDGKSWLTTTRSQTSAYRYALNKAQPTRLPFPRLPAEPLLYDGEMVYFAHGNASRGYRIEALDVEDLSRKTFREVTLPVGTTNVYEIKASPKGDRIGWYVGRGRGAASGMRNLLRMLSADRLLGSNPPPISVEGIWLSRRDGSEMRPLGEVPGEWAPVGMGSFAWCPDGKHVLITYRNGIYKVPVD